MPELDVHAALAPTRSGTNLKYQAPVPGRSEVGPIAMLQKQLQDFRPSALQASPESEIAPAEPEIEALATEAASLLDIREVRTKERILWIAASAVAIALAFASGAFWRTTGVPDPPEPVKIQDPQAEPEMARGEWLQSDALPADPGAALMTGLDRLNVALETVPVSNTNEILRKASTTGKGCELVWAGDLPSVVFGSDPVRPNSLANTLQDCANAVSQLH